MSVIVIGFRVRVGDKTYLAGEAISGLEKEEEQRLVDAGYCRFPDEVTQQEDQQQTDPPKKDNPPDNDPPKDPPKDPDAGGPQTGMPK